jgi:D-alanyl-D-alanine carboxypeptidase/D-alanyl-D-alanine-endopeptidase (penicillin-binding protein 4)
VPRSLTAHLAAPLAALAALLLASPALAAPAARLALDSQLGRYMAVAGRGSGAYVYDLSEHRLLFASRSEVARPPASVEKLYTSTAVLERLGPLGRLSTTLLGVGQLAPAGVWQGNVYLHGGGDPTFGDDSFVRRYYGPGQGTPVSALVTQLLDRGVTEITGSVLGDESLFDNLRGGPTSGYAADRQVEGVLSASAYNRGATGNQRGLHAPAAFAAAMLVKALRQAGIAVLGGAGTGVAPAGAVMLAQARSPAMSTVLRLMDAPSDNYLAETLVKDLGAYVGAGGTTTAGAAVVRQTAAALGIHIGVVDGSGLSRADRTTPHQVATLLIKLSGTPLGPVLRNALAVAGHTGTLSDRMRATAASGRCQAKTGTLNHVSNLAGWCQSAGGHTLVFAILMSGIGTYTAHVLQDRMAVSIARYNDGVAVTPPAPSGPSGSTGPSGPAPAGPTASGGAPGSAARR